MLGSGGVNLDQAGILHRLVNADFFDRATIAPLARISNNDPVLGRVNLTDALQLNFDGHGLGLLLFVWDGMSPSRVGRARVCHSRVSAE